MVIHKLLFDFHFLQIGNSSFFRVKHSCESVLESFVSRYENHFDFRRSVDEETANVMKSLL